MNGTNERTNDVVVIGAGLAGLTAAAYVAAAGHRVTVYERRGRLGGRATTDERNGFLFNQGPHALYNGGPAESVLSELGVEVRGGKPATQAMVWFDGSPHVGPTGPTTLLRTRVLRPREKVEFARVLAHVPKIDVSAYADRTVADWVNEVATTDRLRQMVEALVRISTYSNAPDELSADVALSQIQRALRHGVTYIDGGWQTLVDQLRSRPGIDIVTQQSLTELPDARAVIIATGGPAAAGALLGTTFDVGPAARAACLDLGISQPPRHDVMLGGDVPLYFSNHSAVARLAPPGYYHVAAAQYLGTDDTPDRAAIRAFALAAGIEESSIVEERFLHSMTTVTALPVARNGGMAGRPAIDETGHPNVLLAGDWVGPDGHLADATLASARAAAMAALQLVDAASHRTSHRTSHPISPDRASSVV